MEDWVTIRNLKKKNPNIGTRELAKMLGISRNTIKKALKSDEAPEYNRGWCISEHLNTVSSFT